MVVDRIDPTQLYKMAEFKNATKEIIPYAKFIENNLKDEKNVYLNKQSKVPINVAIDAAVSKQIEFDKYYSNFNKRSQEIYTIFALMKGSSANSIMVALENIDLESRNLINIVDLTERFLDPLTMQQIMDNLQLPNKLVKQAKRETFFQRITSEFLDTLRQAMTNIKLDIDYNLIEANINNHMANVINWVDNRFLGPVIPVQIGWNGFGGFERHHFISARPQRNDYISFMYQAQTNNDNGELVEIYLTDLFRIMFRRFVPIIEDYVKEIGPSLEEIKVLDITNATIDLFEK
jgi:hypothetical protein